MRRWLHIVVPLAILIFSIGLRGADPFLLQDGRLKIFDLFQVLKPRLYDPAPVRLIDLDDESLARLGQWPWPRNLVARWSGLHLVKQGGKGIGLTDPYSEEIPRERKQCPCRGGGVGEIDRGFAMPHRGKRVFNIDPPASSNAIMQRAQPLLRREQ